MLWAVSPIVKKHLLNQLPIETVMLLVSIAYVLTVSMFIIIFRRPIVANSLKKVTPQIVMLICLIVVICGLFPNYLYNMILKTHDVHIVTALVSITPLFVLFYSMVILKENITISSLIGVVFVCIGIAMINQRAVGNLKN